MSHRILAALLLVAASGCAAPAAVGHAPGVTAAEREAQQRTTPRPPIERDVTYVSTVVESDIPVPLDAFSAWFGEQAAPNLSDILVGTKTVPRVVRTEPLSPTWGVPGSRRRVVLADGNTALEELVADARPGLYQYEVWNFTSEAASFVRYAVGTFQFSAIPGGTHVRWQYAFRPKGWPASWLVRSFVHEDYRAFMRAGLDRIRERAVAASSSSHRGTAQD